MINLKEHAVFIDRLQMDMVPLSVAEQALKQAIEETDKKLDKAIELIESSFTNINNSIEPND